MGAIVRLNIIFALDSPPELLLALRLCEIFYFEKREILDAAYFYMTYMLLFGSWTPCDDLVFSWQVKQISVNLARRYRESEWGKQMSEEIHKYENAFEASGEHLPSKEEFTHLNYNTGFFGQFAYVCARTFKNLIRNPRTSFLQVCSENRSVILMGKPWKRII